MARNPAGDANSAAGESDESFVPLPLATDLSAGAVVGEYTVDCKLGDGGMATVYGATHPLIGKKAAIKVMNPALSLDAGLVERFVLEARAVNAIGHPNIVDVFSFGRLSDGRSYFVMEWLQGETLYDRCGSGGRRSTRRSISSTRCATRSRRRTKRASSIATSSRPTCSSCRCAGGATWSSCSTSASPS